MQTKYAVALALILTSSAISSAYAEEKSSATITGPVKYKILTGADYSTGNYGQAETTKILYIPLIVKATYQNWTGKITLPWLRITGPGSVVGGGDTSVVRSGSSAVTTQEGLGDILAALTYNFDFPSYQTYVDVTGKIKFPTADSKKGLGTGERDYTFGTELTKMFGKSNVSFGVSRKLVGSNSTFNLHNIWIASFGAGYKITPNIDSGISYDWRQSSSSGVQPRDATIYFNFKLPNNMNVQTYAVHGFSDGSADNSGGVMLGYKF